MNEQRIAELTKMLTSADLNNSKIGLGFKAEQNIIFYDHKGNIDKKFEWLNKLDLPGVTTVIYAESFYSQQIAQSENRLKAFLDDMAQILGPDIQIVNKNITEVEKALENNSACLFKDGGYLVTGRNDNEAGLSLILMEKACKIKLLADKLVGVKYLDPEQAKFDHTNYLEHYSHAQSEDEK